jgi:hypothetical protein
MPIMMEKLYDALRGVAGEDKARTAAIEAAEFDTRRAHSFVQQVRTMTVRRPMR